MGSVLKLVYEHWYKDYPLPNGMPTGAVEQLKQKFQDAQPYRSNCHIFVQQFADSKQLAFRGHNHVYLHFARCYGTDCMVSIEHVTNDEIYVYPVEIKTNLDSLSQTHNFGGEKYSLLDTMSPTALDLLRLGKIKLLINYLQDPVNYPNDLLQFEQYLLMHNVDPVHVIVVAGNDYHTEYHAKYDHRRLVLSHGDLFFQEAAERITQYPKISQLGYESDIVRVENLDSNKLRPCKFLCFNRAMMHRPHRFVLASLALKHNLLDHNLFSFIGSAELDTVKKSLRMFDPAYESYAERIHAMLPYELDTQNLPMDQKTSFSSDHNMKKLYLDSYIHLTSETRFHHGKTTFISEKTFRPIMNLQPFLFFGNAFSLKKLKDLGFKTFEPFIDESYDLELDPKKRMSMLQDQLIKLANTNIEEIHAWYYSITDILEYNQNHLLSFKDLNPFAHTIKILYNEHTK